MRSPAWLVLACLVCAVSRPALAQSPSDSVASPPVDTSADEEARQHHRLGTAHYENGDFEAAAREFEEAYRLSQRPQLLYNLYLAYRDDGDIENAARCLRLYLERGTDIQDESTLRARLAAYERQLAERATTAPPPSPPSPVPPSERPSVIASSPVGFVVGGVGLAAIAAAVVTGVLANDARLSLDARCGPARDTCPLGFEQDRANGQSLAIAADVLGIAGGVAVAVGTVLVFVVDGREAPPPVAADCGPTGCTVWARGSF